MNNNPNVKSIWPKKDPFAQPANKPKIHDDAPPRKGGTGVKQNDSTAGADDGECSEAQMQEKRARGKVPTQIKIIDFVGTAEGAMLKIMVSVRNFGDALAREVKVKCIGNARLRTLASPMVTMGDIVPSSKSVTMFTYEMPPNFCEEYANFAVSAEAENAKPYSQLYTVKTGRKILSASEAMAKMEAEARSGGDKDKDKKH